MQIRRVHTVNSVIAAIGLATEDVQLRKLANSLIGRARLPPTFCVKAPQERRPPDLQAYASP